MFSIEPNWPLRATVIGFNTCLWNTGSFCRSEAIPFSCKKQYHASYRYCSNIQKTIRFIMKRNREIRGVSKIQKTKYVLHCFCSHTSKLYFYLKYSYSMPPLYRAYMLFRSGNRSRPLRSFCHNRAYVCVRRLHTDRRYITVTMAAKNQNYMFHSESTSSQ